MAAEAEGQLLYSLSAVGDRELAARHRDRRTTSRQRLLAEGLSSYGRQAAQAAPGHAQIPSGDCEPARRTRRGGGGPSPGATARALEVQPVPDVHGAR